MLEQKWQISLFATEKQEIDWANTPNQGALRCVPLSRLTEYTLAVKMVRSTIFEPMEPLTIVLLQQIDILGASPNWLGRPYWPSGAACYGQVNARSRSWVLNIAQFSSLSKPCKSTNIIRTFLLRSNHPLPAWLFARAFGMMF